MWKVQVNGICLIFCWANLPMGGLYKTALTKETESEIQYLLHLIFSELVTDLLFPKFLIYIMFLW